MKKLILIFACIALFGCKKENTEDNQYTFLEGTWEYASTPYIIRCNERCTGVNCSKCQGLSKMDSTDCLQFVFLENKVTGKLTKDTNITIECNVGIRYDKGEGGFQDYTVINNTMDSLRVYDYKFFGYGLERLYFQHCVSLTKINNDRIRFTNVIDSAYNKFDAPRCFQGEYRRVK